MTNEHPASEDLLLWQSGELDPPEAEAVQAHVAHCPQCRELLERHAQTYEEIAWVSGKAAHRRMRAVMAARTRKGFTLPRMAAAGVAAVLIVAVVFFTLDLTPSARADTLLEKAVRQQSGAKQEGVFVLIRSGSHTCEVGNGPQLVSLGKPEDHSESCRGMTEELHRVGWTGKDALSARSFAAWRKLLPRKVDSIQKLTGATEVETETDHGPIHNAMLRLRDSDDHPVAARYEFTADDGEPPSVIEVEEDRNPPPVLLAHSPEPEPRPQPAPAAIVSPLDETEARARLALHQANLDGDVLLAVNREPDAIKVWGVVPTEQAKAGLAGALQNLPQTQMDVLSEGEERRAQQPLPWTAWRGDTPPLANDQLQAQFPNDPQGSQQFLDDLDALTRRLAGETKNRDALLALAARMPASESASPLRNAAAQLQTSIGADLALISYKLQPFGVPAAPVKRPLTYPQAMQLYTLIHELFFTGRSQDPLDRNEAWARVRQLLSGR